jgi:hypothetical protein
MKTQVNAVKTNILTQPAPPADVLSEHEAAIVPRRKPRTIKGGRVLAVERIRGSNSRWRLRIAWLAAGPP